MANDRQLPGLRTLTLDPLRDAACGVQTDDAGSPATPRLRAFLPVGDTSLNNYYAAFDHAPVGLFVLNAAIVTGVTVVLSLLVCSLAALGIAGMPMMAPAGTAISSKPTGVSVTPTCAISTCLRATRSAMIWSIGNSLASPFLRPQAPPLTI